MLFLSCTISKILYIFLNDILPIKGDFNTKYQKAYGKNPSHTKNEDKKKDSNQAWSEPKFKVLT